MVTAALSLSLKKKWQLVWTFPLNFATLFDYFSILDLPVTSWRDMAGGKEVSNERHPKKGRKSRQLSHSSRSERHGESSNSGQAPIYSQAVYNTTPIYEYNEESYGHSFNPSAANLQDAEDEAESQAAYQDDSGIAEEYNVETNHHLPDELRDEHSNSAEYQEDFLDDLHKTMNFAGPSHELLPRRGRIIEEDVCAESDSITGSTPGSYAPNSFQETSPSQYTERVEAGQFSFDLPVGLGTPLEGTRSPSPIPADSRSNASSPDQNVAVLSQTPDLHYFPMQGGNF